MRKKINWEIEQLDVATTRAKVIGGWMLHMTTVMPNKSVSTSMVFIPDRDHEWMIIAKESMDSPPKREMVI